MSEGTESLFLILHVVHDQRMLCCIESETSKHTTVRNKLLWYKGDFNTVAVFQQTAVTLTKRQNGRVTTGTAILPYRERRATILLPNYLFRFLTKKTQILTT